MHSSFQKVFAAIEAQRMKTLESVSHLDDEQLNFSTDGQWSIAQVLSHLVAAEKFSIMYIQKKMLGVENTTNSGIKEEMKMFLLKISQRLPGLKFKAPRSLVENTTTFRDLNSLKKEWDQVRHQLKSILDTLPDEYINRKIYKHVRVGYLNLRHAVEFFGEHVTHHTPQIKKLL